MKSMKTTKQKPMHISTPHSDSDSGVEFDLTTPTKSPGFATAGVNSKRTSSTAMKRSANMSANIDVAHGHIDSNQPNLKRSKPDENTKMSTSNRNSDFDRQKTIFGSTQTPNRTKFRVFRKVSAETIKLSNRTKNGARNVFGDENFGDLKCSQSAPVFKPDIVGPSNDHARESIKILATNSEDLGQQHYQQKFKACKPQGMATWNGKARLAYVINKVTKSQSAMRRTQLIEPPCVVKKKHQFRNETRLTATIPTIIPVTPNIARAGNIRQKTLEPKRHTTQAQAKRAPLMARSLKLLEGFKRPMMSV